MNNGFLLIDPTKAGSLCGMLLGITAMPFVNAGVLEAYNAAHFSAYSVDLADPHGLGIFTANDPPAPAGIYYRLYFRKAGGSLLPSDAPPVAVDPLPIYLDANGVASPINAAPLNNTQVGITEVRTS